MIAQLRAEVADALQDLGIPVSPYPPATIAPPHAVIIPDSPYLSGPTLNAYQVDLQVQIMTAQAAPQSMDELLFHAWTLLGAAGISHSPAEAPSIDHDSGLLTARIPVTLYWK